MKPLEYSETLVSTIWVRGGGHDNFTPYLIASGHSSHNEQYLCPSITVKTFANFGSYLKVRQSFYQSPSVVTYGLMWLWELSVISCLEIFNLGLYPQWKLLQVHDLGNYGGGGDQMVKQKRSFELDAFLPITHRCDWTYKLVIELAVNGCWQLLMVCKVNVKYITQNSAYFLWLLIKY